MTRRRREHFIVDTSAFDSFKLVGKRTDFAMEDIPQLVKEMRACYDSGYTRPRAKRLEQLRQLRKMISENEDRIIEVRWRGFGGFWAGAACCTRPGARYLARLRAATLTLHACFPLFQAVQKDLARPTPLVAMYETLMPIAEIDVRLVFSAFTCLPRPDFCRPPWSRPHPFPTPISPPLVRRRPSSTSRSGWRPSPSALTS